MSAYIVGGSVFTFIGLRKTYTIGNIISTSGGLIILFFGLRNQDSWYFPILVLYAKFGVTLNFGLNYISNPYLFPTLFAATGLGMCNTVARTFSALSPIFAQMEEPLPMLLFTASSCACLGVVFLIKIPKNNPDELISKPYDGSKSD